MTLHTDVATSTAKKLLAVIASPSVATTQYSGATGELAIEAVGR